MNAILWLLASLPRGQPDRVVGRRPDLKQQLDNQTARSTSDLFPGNELARNLGLLALQRLPDILVG